MQKTVSRDIRAVPKEDQHNLTIQKRIVNCVIIKEGFLYYLNRTPEQEIILSVKPMPSKVTRSRKRGWINSLWTFFEQVKW